MGIYSKYILVGCQNLNKKARKSVVDSDPFIKKKKKKGQHTTGDRVTKQILINHLRQ